MLTAWPEDEVPCDRDVHIKGMARALRLVTQRLLAEGAGLAGAIPKFMCLV